MCKLIKTKSEVLSLVLTTEYVNQVFERVAAKPVEEKDDRPLRLHVMESR